MSGTGQKVCGGGGWVVCKPTLVLSLGQAKQYLFGYFISQISQCPTQ